MMPYVAAQRARGVPLRAIARHMLGLYHGMPGGRRFRQLLSDAARLQDAGPELLAGGARSRRARARRGGLIGADRRYFPCLCLRRQRAENRARSSFVGAGGVFVPAPGSGSASSVPPGIARRKRSGATSIMIVAADVDRHEQHGAKRPSRNAMPRYADHQHRDPAQEHEREPALQAQLLGRVRAQRAVEARARPERRDRLQHEARAEHRILDQPTRHVTSLAAKQDEQRHAERDGDERGEEQRDADVARLRVDARGPARRPSAAA